MGEVVPRALVRFCKRTALTVLGVVGVGNEANVGRRLR